MSCEQRNRTKVSNLRLPLPNDPVWHEKRVKELNNEWRTEKVKLENSRYKRQYFANLKTMNPEIPHWDMEIMWNATLRDTDREYREKIYNLVKEVRRENKEQEEIKETALQKEKELKEKKRYDTKERKAAEALLMLQNPELYKSRRSSRIAKNQQHAVGEN